MQLRQRSKVLLKRILDCNEEIKSIKSRRISLLEELKKLHLMEDTILNPLSSSYSMFHNSIGTHADQTVKAVEKIEKLEIKERCKTLERALLVINQQEKALRRLLFVKEMTGGILPFSYSIYKKKENGLSYDNIAFESKRAKTTIIDIINCYGDVVCILFESSLTENEINDLKMEDLELKLDKELFDKIYKYEI